MTIRPAAVADTDGVLELLRQVNNVHEATRPDIFIKDKTKYTAPELAEIFADERRPVFVAVNEHNAVLGYAFCVFEPHGKNNLRDFVTLYIDDICVDETARKSGVGTALFEHVRAFAKARGVYNLTLNVWDKNEAAQAFYEKCGFHIQKYGMETIL